MAAMEGPRSPFDTEDRAEPGNRSDPGPDPVEVVAALRRILDSEELRTAPRSRDFLA
jgi:hypothetical protein